jgi:hypothetical protein
MNHSTKLDSNECYRNCFVENRGPYYSTKNIRRQNIEAECNDKCPDSQTGGGMKKNTNTRKTKTRKTLKRTRSNRRNRSNKLKRSNKRKHSNKK